MGALNELQGQLALLAGAFGRVSDQRDWTELILMSSMPVHWFQIRNQIQKMILKFGFGVSLSFVNRTVLEEARIP